ncbi:hypothetical protein IC582_013159 [Cucumis melo]
MGSDNAIPGKERTSLRPAKDHPLRGSKNLRSRSFSSGGILPLALTFSGFLFCLPSGRRPLP